jgi:hypothetical protein
MARQINKAALKALGKFSEVMVYMDWVYKKISTIFFLVAQMTKYSMGWSVINGPVKK